MLRVTSRLNRATELPSAPARFSPGKQNRSKAVSGTQALHWPHNHPACKQTTGYFGHESTSSFHRGARTYLLARVTATNRHTILIISIRPTGALEMYLTSSSTQNQWSSSSSRHVALPGSRIRRDR
ncbi:unnamed protein product, partial [Mycena citricolor]